MCYAFSYMSNEQADAIYGRVCREVANLTREVALCESELKRIGRDIEITGKQIQGFSFVADRETMEKEIGSMWEIIEKFKKASTELAAKKTEKEKLEHGF